MDFEKEILGKENEYEYCFKQEYSIKEVLEENWVYVDTINSPHAYLNRTCRWLNRSGEDHFIHCKEQEWREYYRRVHKFVQKRWVLQENVRSVFRDQLKKRFEDTGNILAVIMREEFSEEADQNRLQESQKYYREHPLVPSLEETIKIVLEKKEQWMCKKIFLSTLHLETVERFEEEFGAENVFYVQRMRAEMSVYNNDGFQKEKQKQVEYAENTRPKMKETFINYVAELYAASKADYLIGAKCSGTAAALAMNGGKYRDIKILEDKRQIDRY